MARFGLSLPNPRKSPVRITTLISGGIGVLPGGLKSEVQHLSSCVHKSALPARAMLSIELTMELLCVIEIGFKSRGDADRVASLCPLG
jgi:hypothetical protein